MKEKQYKVKEERFSVRSYNERILSPDIILVNYVADREVLHN
jgi:hypothetical protein